MSPRPTTLLIAHRFSTIRDADRVVVLDSGRVIEEGTPAELVAAGGWFSRLAERSQEGVPVSVVDDASGAAGEEGSGEGVGEEDD